MFESFKHFQLDMSGQYFDHNHNYYDPNYIQFNSHPTINGDSQFNGETSGQSGYNILALGDDGCYYPSTIDLYRN